MKLSDWISIFHERLENSVDPRERKSILRILREDLPQIRGQALSSTLDVDQYNILNEALDQLEQGRPIQHITGVSLFYGRYFKVSPDVLIPRQETEELVYKILEHIPDRRDLRVVDACTGSGCIAITIALERTNWHVQGVDVSTEALAVAKENAISLGAGVVWKAMDILTISPGDLKPFDLLITNPPYVPEGDIDKMDRSVVAYEPSLALFVPNNDPLIFYRKLLDLCNEKLTRGGSAWFEIHEDLGDQILEIVDRTMFEKTEVLTDIQGKDRFLHLKNKNN